MYFRFFFIISLGKGRGPSFEQTCILHPRILCAKFGWNWLSGSKEEDFLNFVNVFSLCRNYLPLEKGGANHLNKLESPSPKDALCQVWLNMAQWFWRRRFLNFVNVFTLFRNYLPLEKGGALHLNKVKSPSPKWMLCAKFGWNWPSGSEEKDFLILSIYFCYFAIISPWKRTEPFFWTKLNPLHPRMLCAKFDWNWPSCSGGEVFFLILSVYFRYFAIISP